MDQRKSENQDIPRHIAQCGAYPNLDRSDCVTPAHVLEMEGCYRVFPAANTALAATEFV